MYTNNYKPLKEDQNKTPCVQNRNLNIVETVIVPLKQINKFNTSLTEIPPTKFFQRSSSSLILKFGWEWEGLKISQNTLENEQVWKTHASQFQN